MSSIATSDGKCEYCQFVYLYLKNIGQISQPNELMKLQVHHSLSIRTRDQLLKRSDFHEAVKRRRRIEKRRVDRHQRCLLCNHTEAADDVMSATTMGRVVLLIGLADETESLSVQ